MDLELREIREVLHQHLKAKVRYYNEALAEKITDVLVAEKTNDQIIELLKCDSLLEKNVEKTITSLHMPNTEVQETLGVILFQKVSLIEQELCAQVTGMLLELPVSTLTKLLRDQEELEEAVTKAKGEYLKYIMEEEIQKTQGAATSTKSISKEKQELGEVIYEKLLGKYPTEASKLTGMLLQMEYRDLLRVIAEPEHLNKSVELALCVLQGEQKNQT